MKGKLKNITEEERLTKHFETSYEERFRLLVKLMKIGLKMKKTKINEI